MYCDFYSVVERDDQIPLFTDALMKEFVLNPPPLEEYNSVETVYLGGGTPSMLSGDQVGQLLNTIAGILPIEDDAEVTLEANPGEVDLERMQTYREAGVNRISFGLQSFNDVHLTILGRLHRAEQNAPSVRMARAAGFENVSIDLIFRLPEQTVEEFSSDLDQMIALRPEHLSLYSLTVEPRTPLFQYVRDGRVQLPAEDLDAEMFQLLCREMRSRGFQHYEVSNFAKPGYASRHNSNYWNDSHYYGYGPSAHSYNGTRRWWNVRDLSEYFRRIQQDQTVIAETEYLDALQQQEEYLLTRLRTAEGISATDWEQKFGEQFPEELHNYFEQLNGSRSGLITLVNNQYKLTEDGWLVTDRIVEESVNTIIAGKK